MTETLTAPPPAPGGKLNASHKPADETIKCLAESDVARLFSVIRRPRDRAIFRVMYHRGLRRSEVGMLTLSDYRPVEARLYVHRLKRSHSGEYRLTAAEQKALKAWLKVRGENPGPLFLSREHKAISGRMVHHLYRQYAAAAGLPPQLRHVHVLKHSCVTHVADLLEGDVLAVQDHVGHADVRSTMVYLKFRRRDQIARRIEEWGGKKAA